MRQFIYPDIHIFNKKGIEIPLSYKSTLKLKISSPVGDDAIYYGALDNDYNIYFKQIKSGGRFTKPSAKDDPENPGYAYTKATLEILGNEENAVTIGNLSCKYEKTLNSNSSNDEYDIVDILPYKNVKTLLEENAVNNEIPGFPSLTFQTSVDLDEVSVGLVETESLYVLCKSNTGEYDKIHNVFKSDDFKYDILFFIDNRLQNDFRFFSIKNDELVWTNKISLDLLKDDFRVNVGFSASTEGMYEQEVYVCLVDKADQNNIFPIGSILLKAEAIGEDERYQTLYANFGLPDPSSLQDVFNNTNTLDANQDYITYNKNAKKLFLSYSDIFPYVGTYKALMNAVNVLGYTDLFFKEWYKDLNKSKDFDAGYVAYDMSYKADSNINSIMNINLEERIKLKKLNWISMFYRINEELTNECNDEYGFPIAESVYGFDDPNIVPKLISLKNWLEKYVIGVNCRIIDVGGEGIFFERYHIDTYGTFQEVKEWNNSKNLAPSVNETETNNVLLDSSTYINVDVSSNDMYTSFEDFSNIRFIDVIDGYLANDGIYHSIDELDLNESIIDDYVFVGSTIENRNTFETYEIKASSKVNDFLFNDEYLFTDKNYDLIDSSIEFSSTLRLHDDTLKFSPYDLYKGFGQHSIFTKLPVIKIERANIRFKNVDWNSSLLYKVDVDIENENTSYLIKNFKNNTIIGKSKDYINLIPPKYSLSNDSLEITLCPWKSSEPFTFERFTNFEFESDNIFDETYDSSDNICTPVKIYKNDNTTFGLRYSNDNIYHLPMFLIKGYQFDNLVEDAKNIDPESEFILEILDGKMIFKDDEHNRIVYLNFNFDSKANKQTIEVNLEYHSEDFSIVKYENRFSHFIEGKKYKSFYDNYLNENLNDLISYDTTHSIKVYNSGNFTIDVYARDLHNNIFAAACKNHVNVITPDINLSAFTNVKNDKATLLEDKKFLQDNFIDFCIYDTNYIITDFTKNVVEGETYNQDASLLITYPSYSYSLSNPESNDYINFIDIKDRWKILGLDSCFPNVNINKNDTGTYENYSLVLKKNSYHKYIDVINDYDKDAVHVIYNEKIYKADSSILNATEYLYEDDNDYTFTNTNVIYYNELGGYPICQTYGQIANDKAFNIFNDTYSGNYKLAVREQDDRSYMWGSLKALSTSNVRNSISAMKKTVLAKFEIPDITSLDKYEFPKLPEYDFDSLLDNASAVLLDELTKQEHSKSFVDVSTNVSDYFYGKLANIDYIKKSFVDEAEIQKTLDNSNELFKVKNESYTYYPISFDFTVKDNIFDLFDFRKNVYAFNSSPNDSIDSLITDQSVFNDIINYYTYVYNGAKRNFESYDKSTHETTQEGELVFIKDFILKKQLLEKNVLLSDDITYKSIEQIITDYLKAEFVLNESYVKAIVKAIFTNLKKSKVNKNDYVNDLHSKINTSFYKNVYLSLLDECKSLNALFSNVDTLNISGINTTLLKYIFFQISIDGDEYTKLRDNVDFEILLRNLCIMLTSLDNDDEIKLDSYVCLVFTFFIYIAEQLISNISKTLETIAISKIENGNTYTCSADNMFSLFVIATEPTFHMNALSSMLASLKAQRYLLFKETKIVTLDNSLFEILESELDSNKAVKSLYSNFINRHNIYNDMLLNYISIENDMLITSGYVTKGHISLSDNTDQDVLYAYNADEFKLELSKNDSNYANDFRTDIEYNYVKVPDSQIYLKTSSYVNDGKKHVKDTDNRNVMPKIQDILAKDYISVYTRPSWSIDVIVQELSDETSSVINEALPEIDSSMKFYTVTYLSTACAPKLQKGDVVKISFKNIQTNEYYAASSYTIVCQTTNKYIYVIAGKLNDEFLYNDKEKNLWVPGNFYPSSDKNGNLIYIYDEDASEQFINCEPSENMINYVETTVNDSDKDIKIYSSVKYIDMKNIPDDLHKDDYMYYVKRSKNRFYTYIVKDELSGEKELVKISFDDNDKYRLFTKQVYALLENSNTYVPITIKRDGIIEKINMKMSYANTMFVNYPMKINESLEDEYGNTTLHIEASNKNKAYLDFIDNTYALSINKFNINEGLYAWMNYTKYENDKIVPNILSDDSDIYKSVNSSINVTQDESCVCFCLDSIPENSYVYWKVYRMIDNLNEHKFMFESYNPYLYLDYKDKGIYDIEAFTYDRFGNLTKHMYKGAYVIE